MGRLEPDGRRTVVAGTGEKGAGCEEGPADRVSFNGPHHLLFGPDGGLYVADTWNNCVRRIDLARRLVSRVAGTGEKGFSGDGGPARAARFDGIFSIAFHGSSLYVCDLGNRRVRRVDLSTGVVATVAGDGRKGVPADGEPAISQPLVDPRAVAVDARGRLYIAERGGHALRVVDRAGRIRTVAGTGEPGFSGDGGPALQARFDGPKHIFVDANDDVLITDTENHVIRRYSPRDGRVARMLGTGQKGSVGLGGPADRVELNRPHGAVVHPRTGDLYVSDSDNHRVVRVEAPMNLVLILADDHRYDAMGFLGPKFLQTPHLDALAREGAHFKNAFVTTALCSPSRATLLTGVYAHRHRVVDNNHPVPPGTVFFPERLQAAGYETAFVGKWHMGNEDDAPQKGFDHWVSFPGQGTYLPTPAGLNVDGRRVVQKGYITDELTDYAVNWLAARSADRPFFLYLSHKAVHADFVPAKRHAGRYAEAPFVAPKTMAAPGPEADWPMWTRNQRNSWHGVDFPYHSRLDVAEYYRRYLETLLAVDDSVGRVVEGLRRRGLLERTLVLYMGDNGFAFGEHGLIDKRTAYEESMRVPMLMRAPGVAKGRVVSEVVANLDVMPTFLDAAGIAAPSDIDGKSLLPLARGESPAWRKELLYEYFWERNFPQTPTLHALRGERYKYIRYHGLWDRNELYDLQDDPLESRNLVGHEAHRKLAEEMNGRLFDLLEQTGGLAIPLARDHGPVFNLRRPDGAAPAPIPPALMAKPSESEAPRR